MHGKLNGKAAENSDDYKFFGDYVNGVKQGHGKLTNFDGSTYTGSFH